MHCGCLKPTGIIISDPNEITKLSDNETFSSLGQSPFQLDTLGLAETDLTSGFDNDDLMDELFTTADDPQLLPKDSEEVFGGMEHTAAAAAASQQLLNVPDDPKDNQESTMVAVAR